jgi:hypothetical protein
MPEPLMVVSRARCDEIVEEILDNLKPQKRPKPRGAILPIAPLDLARAAVRQVAAAAQSETHSQNPAAIRAYAKEVSATLAKLESLLKKIPVRLEMSVIMAIAEFEGVATQKRAGTVIDTTRSEILHVQTVPVPA